VVLRLFSLCSGYWRWPALLSQLVEVAIAIWPPPEDGIVGAVADGTDKDKTVKQHPLVKKGRISSYGPDLFGLQIIAPA